MADDHDLDVERRLSVVETKIDALNARDKEILQALKALEASNVALTAKIERYQVGAKVVIGVGTVVCTVAWFAWSNFGQFIFKR